MVDFDLSWWSIAGEEVDRIGLPGGPSNVCFGGPATGRSSSPLVTRCMRSHASNRDGSSRDLGQRLTASILEVGHGVLARLMRGRCTPGGTPGLHCRSVQRNVRGSGQSSFKQTHDRVVFSSWNSRMRSSRFHQSVDAGHRLVRNGCSQGGRALTWNGTRPKAAKLGGWTIGMSLVVRMVGRHIGSALTPRYGTPSARIRVRASRSSPVRAAA